MRYLKSIVVITAIQIMDTPIHVTPLGDPLATVWHEASHQPSLGFDGELSVLLSRVQFSLVRRDVQNPHLCIRQNTVKVAATVLPFDIRDLPNPGHASTWLRV